MKRTTSPTASAPQMRVAIYNRQSVATDLEFGSIDAQREAVEAYVQSQRGEGWVALPDRYDDQGFSGGNTERPAFQRLVADVEAGKVDIIAAYKIDRVSRSLSDFTGFMSMLERYGVGFVSTTQAFDTRTSMGRLTLNILASFSQFERETIAERTRDKIAATRKKGMWTGGRPVLGYDVRDKRLVVNPAEADAVRTVFEVYLEHGGLVATVEELARRGIRNKTWINRRGKRVHGAAFDKNSVRLLLTNPLYLGRIRCGDEIVDGQHDALVDQKLFDEVAHALRQNRRTPRANVGRHGALLSGILRCAQCSAAMSIATSQRGSRLFRYYVCQSIVKKGAAACRGSRAPAGELEEVVVSRIRAIGSEPSVLTETLAAARQARRAKEPELIAESRRLAQAKADLGSQRTNLLDALQHGGAAANAIAGRLAEVDEQLGGIQQRQEEVAAQLTAIATDPVDEDAIAEALAEFTRLWDELVPRERHRVLRLLIEEVRFDGHAGEVSIQFRDNGIRAIARETRDRRPA